MNTIESIELTSLSLHERELKITIPSTMVSRQYSDALNKVQRTAQYKGFRPGKVPKNLVLSLYGHKIRDSLIEDLVDKSFAIACQEKNVVPVSKPQVSPLSKIEQGKAFTYQAVFQVKPTVSSPIYKGLKIELKQTTFSERDIEDELRDLQANMATFITPTGRSHIDATDLVECESNVKIDGVIVERFSDKNYSVPLYAENVPKNVKDALIGKHVGDMASVNVAPFGKHQDQTVSKDGEMQLTIRSFKERILPGIDDEFAKDVSDLYANLQDLKNAIVSRFNRIKKNRDEVYRQEAITRALVEKNSLEVPDGLVQKMALLLLDRELKTLNQKTRDELVKNHWQELWNSVQNRARFRVQAELLIEALLSDLAISATDEEINERVTQFKDADREALAYSIQVEKLFSVIENEAMTTVVDEPLFDADS